jgi:hypothetical protein
MRRRDRSLPLSVVIGVALGIMLVASGHCQEAIPPGALFRALPTTISIIGPGTAYSAATHANADFMRAIGSLRVDTAVARDINADAYTKELNNSKLAVRGHTGCTSTNRGLATKAPID